MGQDLKDTVLQRIVDQGGNVAQHVSFGPDGSVRYHRIRGVDPAHVFASPAESLEALFRSIREGSDGQAPQPDALVNLRTFLEGKPGGNPLFLGFKPEYEKDRFSRFDCVEHVMEALQVMQSRRYYTIVNEDITIFDGGFSGVLWGDTFEFAPKDTPRCVEKPGTAALPREVGRKLIETVYGFQVGVPFERYDRVELSVHPKPVGYLSKPWIIWEVEREEKHLAPGTPEIRWPNRYSYELGDKTYGLLIAHLLGFPVPFTRVNGRYIPYFEFGQSVGHARKYFVRTAPYEQDPGRFSTVYGDPDVFELMQREDPDGKYIAAILRQDAVRGTYAGAVETTKDGDFLIEGTLGTGEAFMVGEERPVLHLPNAVEQAVRETCFALKASVGPFSLEWVWDEHRSDSGVLWVVQLHTGTSKSDGDVIYPGTPVSSEWWDLHVSEGLETLRNMIPDAKAAGAGIVLIGNVGITSHWGQLLKKGKVPSQIKRDET